MAIAVDQEVWYGLQFGGTSIDLSFAVTPAENDILVIIFKSVGDTSVTISSWPSGFTEFLAESAYSDGMLAAAWKRAGSSESQPYTVTYSGASATEVLIGKSWTGCITSGDPIDDVSTFTDVGFDNNIDVGDLTTTVADCMHETYLGGGQIGDGTDNPVMSGGTRYHFDASGFLKNSAATYSRSIAGTGATGNFNISKTGGIWGAAATFSFALKPDGGGGGGGLALPPGLLVPNRARQVMLTR